MTCFDNLVGLRSLCGDSTQQPLYYIDDVEGMNASRLADLAEVEDGSGKALATRLIESSIRIMQGDIEALIPPMYQITNNQLANVCSACNWSGFYSAASALGTGVIVKNASFSQFAQIIIPSLRVRINNTGSFSFTITDGVQTRTITHAFVAGQEVTFTNVNFKTDQPAVRIGFNDPAIMLAQVICPPNTSCGCGASPATAPTDLKITGLHMGVETEVQYGFLACAMISCSYDKIICSLVQSSPRLFGLTLLQLVASKAFATQANSQRVNRTAGYNEEEQKEESEVFYGYYQQRLKGNPSKGILGISQTISNNLSLLKDQCVSCNSPVGIAWATG